MPGVILLRHTVGSLSLYTRPLLLCAILLPHLPHAKPPITEVEPRPGGDKECTGVAQLVVSGTGIRTQAEQIFLITTTSCLTRLLKQLGIRIDTRVAESTF